MEGLFGLKSDSVEAHAIGSGADLDFVASMATLRARQSKPTKGAKSIDPILERRGTRFCQRAANSLALPGAGLRIDWDVGSQR